VQVQPEARVQVQPVTVPGSGGGAPPASLGADSAGCPWSRGQETEPPRVAGDPQDGPKAMKGCPIPRKTRDAVRRQTPPAPTPGNRWPQPSAEDGQDTVGLDLAGGPVIAEISPKRQQGAWIILGKIGDPVFASGVRTRPSIAEPGCAATVKLVIIKSQPDLSVRLMPQ